MDVNCPERTPASNIVELTDKSKYPQISSNIIPNEIIAVGAMLEYHKVISMLSDLYSKSIGDEGKTEIVKTLNIIQSEFTGGGHI